MSLYRHVLGLVCKSSFFSWGPLGIFCISQYSQGPLGRVSGIFCSQGYSCNKLIYIQRCLCCVFCLQKPSYRNSVHVDYCQIRFYSVICSRNRVNDDRILGSRTDPFPSCVEYRRMIIIPVQFFGGDQNEKLECGEVLPFVLEVCRVEKARKALKDMRLQATMGLLNKNMI